MTALSYLAVEVSWGSTWVDINDSENYKISGDGTRDQVGKTWRKITAQSPVLGGTYLVHAVPEMVAENVSVWVYGQDATGVAENYFALLDLFEQYDYRIRWTFDSYQETWRCQLADATSSRGQVWSHNNMAVASFQVPRFPEVDRERI